MELWIEVYFKIDSKDELTMESMRGKVFIWDGADPIDVACQIFDQLDGPNETGMVHFMTKRVDGSISHHYIAIDRIKYLKLTKSITE